MVLPKQKYAKRLRQYTTLKSCDSETGLDGTILLPTRKRGEHKEWLKCILAYASGRITIGKPIDSFNDMNGMGSGLAQSE